jgi:hypothetical protein
MDEEEYEKFKEISNLFESVIIELTLLKPDDRSIRDKNFAICITDLRKIQAFYEWFMMPVK